MAVGGTLGALRLVVLFTLQEDTEMVHEDRGSLVTWRGGEALDIWELAAGGSFVGPRETLRRQAWER